MVYISYVLSIWTILLAFLQATLRILGWLTVDLELMMLLILLITIFYSNAVVFSTLRMTYIYAPNAVLHLIVSVSIFYSLILLLQMLFPKFVHI
jgi:hypothetical protein